MPTPVAGKYRPYPTVPLADRQWPSRTITRPPVWCSVDLRDGNQALVQPMDIAQKRRLWQLLVAIGFTQIEVGFPSASATEFRFVRELIEQDMIPDKVTIQVLVPAREAHIVRGFEALDGVPRAIVHLYNSTSTRQREVVFGKDRAQVQQLAVDGARWMVEQAARYPQTDWSFEYSPESFTGTEPDFAVQVCEAVTAVLKPASRHPVIINLPSTVETSTPNVYADQIEWFGRQFGDRAGITLSVHPHNDRGTAVAAAELAMMAGAERVEGTLFGNGERTGNVDVITLAMNLYTQGVDPGLDFSHMEEVIQVVEECTRMTVPPRHPYAGELVFTAFSGSHQDAIRKGLAAQRADGPWQVPYLPLDPRDVGQGLHRLVRLNSQSGKGGAAHLLQQTHGLRLPRAMEIALGAAVKTATDDSASELDEAGLWQVFETAFMPTTPLQLVAFSGASPQGGGDVRLSVELCWQARSHKVTAIGSGPLEALCSAITKVVELPIQVGDFVQHTTGDGAEAKAAAYVQVTVGDGPPCYGAGVHTSVVEAPLRALVAAVNNAL